MRCQCCGAHWGPFWVEYNELICVACAAWAWGWMLRPVFRLVGMRRPYVFPTPDPIWRPMVPALIDKRWQ
jgi:hypothetical protein